MDPENKKFSAPLDYELSPFWSEFQNTIGDIVLGQERAIRKMIRSLVVLESGLHGSLPPNPLLFVGPPGSGKTFLAEAMAELWLGKAPEGQIGPLVKLSGENFTSAHEGSTLKGAPPGYLGYGDKATLEDVGFFDMEKRLASMRREGKEVFKELEREYPNLKDIPLGSVIEGGARNITVLAFLRSFVEQSVFPEFVTRLAPFRSVLLVDEFEKMHPTVQKQFLGIFDTGKLEMLNGRVVDFRSCQIILTGNIGTELITREFDRGGFGFTPRRKLEDQNQEIYELVRNEVKKTLDPAIYSRVGHDGIIVFHALSQEDYARIFDIEIRVTEKHIRDQSDGTFRIHTTSAFRKFLLSLADTPSEGARQVKRIVLKQMREPLASLIEAENLFDGDEVRFGMSGGAVDVRRRPHSSGSRKPISKQRRSESGWKDELRRDLRERIDNFLDAHLPLRDDLPDLGKSDD